MDQKLLRTSSRVVCWLVVFELKFIESVGSKEQMLNRIHYTWFSISRAYQIGAWTKLNHLRRNLHQIFVGFKLRNIEALRKWLILAHSNRSIWRHQLYYSLNLLHSPISFYGSLSPSPAHRSITEYRLCRLIFGHLSFLIFSKIFEWFSLCVCHGLIDLSYLKCWIGND